jgi:hypothetical protein
LLVVATSTVTKIAKQGRLLTIVNRRERAHACGPACSSPVMNDPSCPAPFGHDRPVRAHHRRNNAIEYA